MKEILEIEKDGEDYIIFQDKEFGEISLEVSSFNITKNNRKILMTIGGENGVSIYLGENEINELKKFLEKKR